MIEFIVRTSKPVSNSLRHRQPLYVQSRWCEAVDDGGGLIYVPDGIPNRVDGWDISVAMRDRRQPLFRNTEPSPCIG
jgi:hypothetical protein